MSRIQLSDKAALIIVDVQKDFLPGGNLPVPNGDQVVPVINEYIERFHHKGRPIFATRDWHPLKHCSFVEQGGPWPEHCVAYTEGATFASGLKLPSDVIVISKGSSLEQDAYSGFQSTDLDNQLRGLTIERLFIGGLALDVCVLNTVMDAIQHGFRVFLLEDATYAVNAEVSNGEKAIVEMKTRGTQLLTLEQLA
ncbi:MAG: nicotinamidase [Proteobacteria bacterium]|nr:nicotinamidase [Pseudomonadota bacterium]